MEEGALKNMGINKIITRVITTYVSVANAIWMSILIIITQII